eukprot:jgi/Chlat1/8514/Chrsp80S09221
MESASSAPEVVLETSMGAIVVELYKNHTPRAVKNFMELAKRGYYDGVKFHRIIRGFMAQTGDPTGTGRGKHTIFGRVSAGMPVVKRPLQDIKIIRAYIQHE